MKKKVLISASSIVVLVLIITLSVTLFKNDENIVLSNNNKNLINNSFLTLMLEQEDGTYQESKSNTWPSGNYAFNSELSRCENGGELRWDREEGIVELLSNKSDACYVYFDLYNVVQISNVEATTTYNSITVTVTTSGGENPVDKYYFSIDGGNSYQESSTPSYTFSNLTMNHEYTIQVYAKDTLGYESNEETIKVTTDNYVNPVVNSVTATNVTNDSITVSVSASAGTNNIQSYYYSINNGNYTSSSSNTYTFSGLSSGTNYSIRVYVKDTNGVDSNVYTINAETESVTYICNTGTNLATCIKNQYTSQGSNGIYYHTSSLANSAADNSYRYVGANPNNYVCFGSDASTCPSDNLYRIIGVFGNEVKLIKNTSYGSYAWDSGNINTWNSSTKPDIRTTLNSTFLGTLSSTWQNKIATHAYKVGGMSNSQTNTAKEYYNTEVGSSSSSTTDSMKIGLMYVSDYGFAASPDYWTMALFNYEPSKSSNWMNININEWTISRGSDLANNAFRVSSAGYVGGSDFVINANAVRPVFYLNSSITYASGSGSSADPIRIN